MDVATLLCDCDFKGYDLQVVLASLDKASVDCANYYHDKAEGRIAEAIFYGFDAIKRVLAVHKAARGNEIRFLTEYNPANGLRGLPFPAVMYPRRCFDLAEYQEIAQKADSIEQTMTSFCETFSGVAEVNMSFATLVDECDTWVADALELYRPRVCKFKS